MAQHDRTPPRDNPDVSHEVSDVNIRMILALAVGLIIAAIVIHIALYWLLEYYKERSARRQPAISTMPVEEQIPPPPRLQVSPQTDLAELRAAEEKQLQTYGWADRDKRIVRIPVDRAMELVAERGLPARNQAEEERGKTEEQSERKKQRKR